MLSSSIAFSISLVAALFLTMPVRRLALRFGMVDQPNPRKLHLRPIPLLGGVAIYSGFVLAVIATVHSSFRAESAGILAAATLLALTGFIDDSGKLHHQIKLFVSMPAAACILLASGIRADIFSPWIGGRTGAAFDILLTILWVVGVTAAFSILDHMDGLCAGIAAIAAAFFTIAALWNGQVMVATLAAASLGAALGFLRWNFAPAKIFMGDGGAMFLGFLMATLGLKLRMPSAHAIASNLLPVLILGVPIFDTTLISISRSRRGLLPFTSPGKDHTAHRLANLGLGQTWAVLALYCLGGVLGALGLLLAYSAPEMAVAAIGALVLVAIAVVVALERSPYERQPKAHGPAPLH